MLWLILPHTDTGISSDNTDDSMKFLSRLTTTLSATTERAVVRFENHDAITAAAVRGAREAVTAARVRHARLQREGERRREQLASLQTAEMQWRDRARASAASDQANALACLERRRAVEARIDDARGALEEHQRVEQEMQGRLTELERRLENIIRRRDALRSRESMTRAADVLDSLHRDDGDGLEDVFERWEVRIADDGARLAPPGDNPALGTDAPATDDALARRYAVEEHEASLQAELTSLVGEKPETEPGHE